MIQTFNNDVLTMLEFIASHNTPEQIEEAEREADGDDIQVKSFALLKQFVAERRA